MKYLKVAQILAVIAIDIMAFYLGWLLGPYVMRFL